MTALLTRLRNEISSRPYHLSLLFLLVWIIKPLYQGHRFDWILLAIAWTIFAALYALAHAARRHLYLAGVIGISLLGVLYVPLNPEAAGIFSFAAAILAAGSPRANALWLYLLSVNVLLLAECLVFHLNLWAWIGGGSGAVVLSLYVLLNARERDTSQQLRCAQHEIARLAKLAERERITRDLHDVLGHTLSLIVMKSELAQKQFSASPQATVLQAQQIETIAREALVRVRETIHGYAAPSLAPELDRIVAALRSVGLTVHCSADIQTLTPVQQSIFAMVLKEASTNILRHAHASTCRIQILQSDNTVSLRIQDDGRGSPNYEGFGLRAMRERLQLLGGSLQVTAHHGTTLAATLPRF